MKKIIVLVAVFALLLAVPLAVSAGNISPQKSVFIAQDEVINHNIFRAGNAVTIEGTINGDVFVAGSIINIKGTVTGSIFAAGSSVIISGQVDGDVFAAGSSVTISGDISGSTRVAGSDVTVSAKVAQSAYMVGANLSLTGDAEVGRDVAVSGANINLAGTISRNADAYGENVTISGPVGNNLNLRVDSTGIASIAGGVKVAGNVSYMAGSEDQLIVDDSAEVSGATTFSTFSRSDKKLKKKAIMPSFLFKVVWFFSMLVVGFVLVVLMPKPLKSVSEKMIKRPAVSMGWGLVYLILTPIVSVLLLITVIGIPLAIIVMVVYIIALYLMKILAAIVLGALIISAIRKQKEPGLSWSLVIGAIVFILLTSIPVIGWIINFLAVIWALGAAVEAKKEMLKKINS
jgi:hypothetical protein